MNNINNQKLKRIFTLCLIALVVVLILSSCDLNEVIKKEEIIEQQNVNVENMHYFEKLDYNNLSSAEKNYICEKYSNLVKFTENGVEVYDASVEHGTLNRIITSSWPNNEIGNFIPCPEYGELDKIEYSRNKIEVYIKNAKKSDAKDYLKQVKKYNFIKNETKNDGDVMLEYKVYDELGNYVKIRFMYDSKELKISAKKVK